MQFKLNFNLIEAKIIIEALIGKYTGRFNDFS